MMKMMSKTDRMKYLLTLLVIFHIQISGTSRIKRQSLDELDTIDHGPVQERLVAEDEYEEDEDIRVEAQPQAPYWLKPKQMERQVYAEVLNTQVKLKCPAGGEPQPTIQWLKDGLPIEKAKRPPHLKEYLERKEKWQLTIPGMIYSDEGNYTCIVQNTIGVITHTFRIEALAFLTHKPVLVDQSDNQTVMEGMTANFFCKFKSDLGVLTNWVRPSKKAIEQKMTVFDPKDPESFEVLHDPESGEPVSGEYFTIKNAKLSDSGLYFCAGQTNSGMTPGFLHLKVLEKSEAVLEKPENVSVAFGDDAVFSCRTHKALREFTSWVRFNKTQIVELQTGTEVLRIHNVTKNDLGYYACVVGTDQAHVQHVALLEAEEPSSTPVALKNQKLQALAISISVVTVILFVAVVLIWRRFQREKEKKKQAIANAHAVTQWTKKVIIERQSVGPESPIIAPVIRIEKQNSTVNSANRSRLGSENTTLTTISEYELPLDPDWEWPRSYLTIGPVLGEGQFGKVFRAEVSSMISTGMTGTTVAVKTLKEGHTDSNMIDLVSEMDMMKMIGKHINIINLLGVCTQDGPLYVIVEYAEHGNLRDFLKRHSGYNDGYERPNTERPIISEKNLLSFARQVCKGMDYLHSKKCIHRDLAARNILVAKDYIIKIADFGLARDVHNNDYYKKVTDGLLPIKWMAPETIFQRVYSTRSDVWSFGVLLWEIMALGATPYPSVDRMDRLLQLLKVGIRMEKPANCSHEVFMIMQECWSIEPTRRPPFAELVEDLDRLLTSAREGDYLAIEWSTGLNSNGESMFCMRGTMDDDDEQIGRSLICGSSNTPSMWTSSPRGSSPADDHGIFYTQAADQPPTMKAPSPPELPLPPQIGYPVSNSHTNMTYQNGFNDSDVTYTPLMSNYWNNNIYTPQQTSTFRPQPPKRNSPPHHPYVNHVTAAGLQHQPEQNFCDQASVSSTVSSDPEVTLAMDDITVDEFMEQYGEHLQSSSL